jgi:hypothetical protein
MKPASPFCAARTHAERRLAYILRMIAEDEGVQSAFAKAWLDDSTSIASAISSALLSILPEEK